jgi:hypothetical protein
LRWRQRRQRRQLLERLHDADEDVEIESEHRTHDVNPPPRSGEAEKVERDDRRRQHQELDLDSFEGGGSNLDACLARMVSP